MSRPRPTLRGWVVGACGIVALVAAAWLARVDLLFIGLLLTLAPLAALIAVALDRPWLTVTRSYSPDSVTAGESAQVRLEVRNQSARTTPALTWRDSLPAELAPVPPQSFPSLGPRADGAARGADSVTLRYTARTRRRGAFLLGPLLVVRTDPFGLASCGYLAGEQKLLLVTPRVSRLERGGPDEARGEGTDHELVRHSIPSPDEVIPRDYHPGDPLRRVQWRATARQDRLMVRQEEQRSNPQALVLLDTMREHRSDGERFERAVELAASVSCHLLDLGYLVALVETGERQLSGSYELPGGDLALIGQLAAVGQTAERDDEHGSRLSTALRAGSVASPAFLILVDGDPAAWLELASLRRFAEPAVAFLMTPAAREAEAALSAAGWVCVPCEAGTDAAAAWSSAVVEHQQRRSARYSGAGRG